MKIFALFDAEGFPVGFWNSVDYPNIVERDEGESVLSESRDPRIPSNAIEISAAAHTEFMAHNGFRKWNFETRLVEVYTPPGPTIDEQWATLRAERDRLLRESDIRVLPDRWAVMSSDEQGAWSDYRQALRDLPENVDLHDTQWPEEPTS